MSALFARYRAAFAGLPREAWIMALVLFVNRAGTMVLPFLTLYLAGQIGMSKGMAAAMVSVYGCGAVVGSYLGGRWAHRFGGLRAQAIGLSLSGPACLLIPLWKSWPGIAASLFAWSLFSSAVRPANAATIARATTPAQRTRAFALQRLAANFGFSFGPTVGGLLASRSYVLLFIVDGVTSLLAFAVLGWYLRTARRDAGTVDRPKSTPVSPWVDRHYVSFMLLVLAGMSVFFQFGSTYPLYLHDHYRLNEFEVGLMFAVNTVLVVLFEMPLVDAARNWPNIRTVGWGTFVFCLGFGMLPWGTSGAYAVVAMMVMTAGEMLSASLSAAFASNRAPLGSEPAYLGGHTVVQSLAWMIGPSVGGIIYQRNPDAVWSTGLVVGTLALVGFLALSRRVGETRTRLDAEESAVGLPHAATSPVLAEQNEALSA